MLDRLNSENTASQRKQLRAISSIGLMVVTWKNPLDFTAARIVAYAVLPSPPS